MPLMFTQDQIAEAGKLMGLDEDVRMSFLLGFNFAVVQSSQLEPDLSGQDEVYSFLACGMYSVTKRHNVQTSLKTATQFGKFLNALLPNEEDREFRSRVTGYFAKTFHLTMEAA